MSYKTNKSAKVGNIIICPICGEKFVKKQYSQAFCSLQCKDTYWNYRRTPTDARMRYLDKMSLIEDEHPFSCEGLGQW